MYILLVMIFTAACMFAYAQLHEWINEWVAGIQKPWLRNTVSISLKLITILTSIIIWLFTVLFILMFDSAREKNKS